MEPAPWRFPARNRIIAGLSAVTIVVEARERSGALITADLALEEGREVFAVPGEITSALSSGTNDLLRLGATPLLSSADVLEIFGLAAFEPGRVELTPTADAVLSRLRDGPTSATSSSARPDSRRAPSPPHSRSWSWPAVLSPQGVCTERTGSKVTGEAVLGRRKPELDLFDPARRIG